jgi:hypothetical protein
VGHSTIETGIQSSVAVSGALLLRQLQVFGPEIACVWVASVTMDGSVPHASGVVRTINGMLTNQLHGPESHLTCHQLLSYSRISQHFIEPHPSLVPILSQSKPVYTTPSYLRTI